MRILIISLSILIVASCATAYKINRISLGMTKAEVIQIMGEPQSVSAIHGVEYLNYRLSETDDHAFVGITTPYFVRIINGKVESYGRMGDFDSTNPPKSAIDLTIKKK